MDASAMFSAVCEDSSRWTSFALNSAACDALMLPWAVSLWGDGREGREGGREEEGSRLVTEVQQCVWDLLPFPTAEGSVVSSGQNTIRIA